MLVGVILGDAHLGRTGLDKAFITFEQSSKKSEYLNFLHKIALLEGIASEEPRTYARTDHRYNIRNESLYFRTKSLEEFKPFADTFLNSEGKQIIWLRPFRPPSNISELWTPRSLAFWIMDDGQQVKKGGVTLCTDSFDSEEISLLRKGLETNFNLITSIHKKRGKNDMIYERIYIKKIYLEEIKSSLKEHMHESMLYKINEIPQ
jgi:hypothetical protein